MPHHAKSDTNPRADLDAIRARAETFFEWDTDRRDVVTRTSCLLFAQACVEEWQPVGTAPTDTPLLATYLDEAGKPKVIRAKLIGLFSQEASPDDDCTEYDPTTDTYFRAAGWVELMDHWNDHDSCYIHADIIGWMPLPEPMEPPAC